MVKNYNKEGGSRKIRDCPFCRQWMRADNLSKHMQTCQKKQSRNCMYHNFGCKARVLGPISRHEAECKHQPDQKIWCPICQKWKPPSTSHSPGECQLRAYQRRPRMTFCDAEFGEKTDRWEPPDSYEALCEISKQGGIMSWLPLRYCCDTPPSKLSRSTVSTLKTYSQEAKAKWKRQKKPNQRLNITNLPPAKEIRELVQADIRTAFPRAKLTVRKPIRKKR